MVYRGDVPAQTSQFVAEFVNTINYTDFTPRFAFPKGTTKEAVDAGNECMLSIRFYDWLRDNFPNQSKVTLMREAACIGARGCIGGCNGKKGKVMKGDFCCNKHPMDIPLDEKFKMFMQKEIRDRYLTVTFI
jgi:hypothetical protein